MVRSINHGPQPKRGVVPAFVKKIVLFLIFIYIGTSIGIPGSTLIFIERLTSSREDEVALIFSARAVGSLAGWLLCLLVMDMKNAFDPVNLMGVGILGLILVHFLLIWVLHIWWVMCAFVFQGSFIALSTQGCLAFVQHSGFYYKPHASQQLIFACLLGCVITPFIAFPFLKSSAPPPSPHSLTFFLIKQYNGSENSLHTLSATSPNNVSSANEMKLKRLARAVVSTVQFVPILGLNQSVSSSSYANTNDSITSSIMILSTTEPATTVPVTELSTTGSPLSGDISSITTTTPILTSPPPPMKPPVNDAMHLNQDSSSADGSHTASKMKQLDEDRKIDTLAGVPAVSIHVVTAKPSESDTRNPDMPLSENVHDGILATGISIDLTSSTPTTTSVSKFSIQNGTTASATSDFNATTLSVDVINSSVSHMLLPVGDVPSSMSNLTDLQMLQWPSGPTLGEFSHSSTHTTDVTGYVTTTATTMSNVNNITIVSPTTTTSTISNISSLTPIDSSTTTHTSLHPILTTTRYKHIAERRSSTPSIRPLYSNKRLLPIQRLYATLSLIGLILWLVTLTLTHCPLRKWTATIRTTSLASNEISLRRIHATGGPVIQQNEQESPAEYQLLLSSRDDDTTDCDEVSEDSHTDSRDQSLVAESDHSHQSSSLVPSGSRGTTIAPMLYPMQDQVLSSALSRNLSAIPRWPQISWPDEPFLLFAEFSNVGLETSYGAFIHGFTVRYLFWPPALAFLAVSLFWIGALVGRLPGVFLRETHITPRRNASRHRRVLDSSDCSTGMQSSSLASSDSPWWLSAVRLSGAVLCMLMGIVLTRHSVSTNRYTQIVITNSTTPPSLLHDCYIWLGGSLCMGLGVGLASAASESVIFAHHTDRAYRLQLAGLLSQLFVPPLIAYAHHLAVYWRYTCVLSTSALVLSICLGASLLGHLIQLFTGRTQQTIS